MLCQAVGVLSSAYTSGWLVGWAGARPTLGVMALFPLLMCGTAFLIKERRRSPQSADLEVVRVPQEVVAEGEEGEELLGEPWRREDVGGLDAQEGVLIFFSASDVLMPSTTTHNGKITRRIYIQ